MAGYLDVYFSLPMLLADLFDRSPGLGMLFVKFCCIQSRGTVDFGPFALVCVSIDVCVELLQDFRAWSFGLAQRKPNGTDLFP